jgi:hypothetical protein
MRNKEAYHRDIEVGAGAADAVRGRSKQSNSILCAIAAANGCSQAREERVASCEYGGTRACSLSGVGQDAGERV